VSSLLARPVPPAPVVSRPEPHQIDSARRSEAAGSTMSVHRAISLLALLGLFWPLMNAWGDIVSVPASGLAVVAMTGAGLWLVAAVATARSEEALERLDRWLLVLGLLVLVAQLATKLVGSSGYGTDEAAFEQSAATLLLHGHDPYGVNLTTALSAFSTPSKYLTYTMSGGTVSTYGYPALPLFVVAPFVQLTGGGQAVPIADTFVLMLATVLVFRQLPKAWRGLAIVLCVGFPALAGFAYTGVNLIIAMTALLVVAFRWTATGRGGRLGRDGVLRALAFGLALSCNQLAWFIAPFLLVGIFLIRRTEIGDRRALGVVTRYLGLAAGTFALVNAPFVIWNPGAWLHGVAAPLTQHAIPYGQGLVGLTLFLRLGGGAMDAYNYAAALLYVGLLVLYATRFRTLGRACFVLPLLALFVSGRSLAEYWMTTIAVMAVAVLSARESEIRAASPLRLWPGGSSRAGRWASAALFVPAAVCLAVALGTPQPLDMHIVRARSNSALRSVQDVQIWVHNRTDGPLEPHFATNVSGQAVLWPTRSGPPVLAAHASAVYRLSAPDPSSMPPNGTKFMVEAVTGSPRTISSTAQFAQKGPVPGYW
jgi:hypothetical protein